MMWGQEWRVKQRLAIINNPLKKRSNLIFSTVRWTFMCQNWRWRAVSQLAKPCQTKGCETCSKSKIWFVFLSLSHWHGSQALKPWSAIQLKMKALPGGIVMSCNIITTARWGWMPFRLCRSCHPMVVTWLFQMVGGWINFAIWLWLSLSPKSSFWIEKITLCSFRDVMKEQKTTSLFVVTYWILNQSTSQWCRCQQ